jgi:hypothetical protein
MYMQVLIVSSTQRVKRQDQPKMDETCAHSQFKQVSEETRPDKET